MIIRLKRTPGIYVVGFMASGKTTIGRLLAERLAWNFADIDDDIEAEHQMTISDMFEKRGEDEFRRIESAAIIRRVDEVRKGHATVVALGGGAFAQPANAALVRDHGVSVWLDCPFEIVERRVRGLTHRPLARDPQTFAELFEARRAAYEMADYHIRVTSDEARETLSKILLLPGLTELG